jgi:hypothetical protein
MDMDQDSATGRGRTADGKLTYGSFEYAVDVKSKDCSLDARQGEGDLRIDIGERPVRQ